jgi:hypothetical protein
MYVCLYMYIYICVHPYAFTYTCAYPACAGWLPGYMHIMHTRTSVCIYIHTYILSLRDFRHMLCMYMYTRMYMYIRVRLYAFTYIRTYSVCAAWLDTTHCITGSMDGRILLWQDKILMSAVKAHGMHAHMCVCMYVCMHVCMHTAVKTHGM